MWLLVSAVSACKQSFHANISWKHLGSHRQPQGVFTREPKHTFDSGTARRGQKITLYSHDASRVHLPIAVLFYVFLGVSTLSRIVGTLTVYHAQIES